MLDTIRQLREQAGMVTDLDRRKCGRRVPMRVLVLGMPRTGSTSLKAALEMLGYYNVYHGEDAWFLNPRDCEMWMAALNAKFEDKGPKFTRTEWDQLLGHCQAVSDMPAICFGPELVEAYPEAKVVLPTREFEGWHKSVKPFNDYFSAKTPMLYDALNRLFLTRDRRSMPTFRKAWNYLFQGEFVTRSREHYEEHYSAIASATPKDRLLYWNVKEGWEPLCKFLEVPIPEGPFPHLNDARALAEGTKSSHQLMIMQYAMKATQVAAYVSLIWVSWKVLSRYR